jgi:hypothetical protein
MTPVGHRVRAWVALLAFLGGLALPFLNSKHFGADDDAACGQVSLYSGHTRLEFRAEPPPAPRDHCALCHWQRAVGGASPASPLAAFSNLAPDALRPVPATRVAGASAVRQRPSRAPPASILS